MPQSSRPLTRALSLALAFILVLALAIALTLFVAGSLAAQDVAGVALGPDGEPLAEFPVLLHRVGGAGGAMAGTDTTTATGEFRFALPAGDSAVFFVTLRYDDDLYVGPAVMA
ncbi:MAG: hypothetical protein ACOC5I_01010, partial [Gemmatimonadota bacterium]